MFSTYAISLLLIGLCGLMLDWHRRTWRQAQADRELSERERRFALSQYRRRSQASGIIGLIGVAIGLQPLVPRAPFPVTCYAIALVFACGCILVLAMLDAWATRQEYRRIHADHVTAQVKLAAELRAMGHAPDAES